MCHLCSAEYMPILIRYEMHFNSNLKLQETTFMRRCYTHSGIVFSNGILYIRETRVQYSEPFRRLQRRIFGETRRTMALSTYL